MSYFTWKETGLTSDCTSLDSMAARLEEAASLIRKMSKEGFKLEIHKKQQLITHNDKQIFDEWGFISEEKPFKQLKLIPDIDP